MSRFISKLSAVIRANANDADDAILERFEDPEKMLRQQIRDLGQHDNADRRAHENLLTQYHLMKGWRQRCRTEADHLRTTATLHARAAIADPANQLVHNDRARTALHHALIKEEAAQAYDALLEGGKKPAALISEWHRTHAISLRHMQQAETLLAQERLRKAREAVDRTQARWTELGGPFHRITERIEKAEARARANVELNAESEVSAADASVEAELIILKEQLKMQVGDEDASSTSSNR